MVPGPVALVSSWLAHTTGEPTAISVACGDRYCIWATRHTRRPTGHGSHCLRMVPNAPSMRGRFGALENRPLRNGSLNGGESAEMAGSSQARWTQSITARLFVHAESRRQASSQGPSWRSSLAAACYWTECCQIPLPGSRSRSWGRSRSSSGPRGTMPLGLIPEWLP